MAIDRLKPAYIEKPPDRLTDNEPIAHENKNEKVLSTDDKCNYYRKTKSGRHIYRPTKLKKLRITMLTYRHTYKK